MKLKALQTANITLNNRTINAVTGESYEFDEKEAARLPLGYFEAETSVPPQNEKKRKR